MRQNPEDPALHEIVRRLVKSYAPLEVYLFGSKARGESGPDSDYELLPCPAMSQGNGREPYKPQTQKQVYAHVSRKE